MDVRYTRLKFFCRKCKGRVSKFGLAKEGACNGQNGCVRVFGLNNWATGFSRHVSSEVMCWRRYRRCMAYSTNDQFARRMRPREIHKKNYTSPLICTDAHILSLVHQLCDVLEAVAIRRSCPLSDVTLEITGRKLPGDQSLIPKLERRVDSQSNE